MESKLTKELLLERRANLEDLLKRRFYIMQSFGIYGGKAGFFDFGPPGCAIKANVEKLWREHFVIEDDILEINCTNITPEEVLVASGHVEKFADIMVKDEKDSTICYRADHLIEEHIETTLAKDKKLTPEKRQELETVKKDLPNYKLKEIAAVIKSLGIKSTKTGNGLSEPYEFNLMFGVQIGPTGDSRGFLRPETAQGMFVNFRNLLEYNGGRIPFGCAQIGLGFRNEIAPRSGLLRVREFSLAEIEYFVDPQDKSFSKFKNYKDQKLTLFPRDNQTTDGKTVEMTIGEAVEKGIVNNETLAYFIIRTYHFLLRVGCLPEGIRFRQHLLDEKAHYSSDCWDAEVLTSYGWVEVVGIADRSAYDLTKHAEHSKKELVAARKLKSPKLVKYIEATVKKEILGKTFKQNNKLVLEHIESLSDEDKLPIQAAFDKKENYVIKIKEQEFTLTPDMITFKAMEKNVMEEKYVPNVIEPAFGIGRIIYAAWEHNFRMRTKERTYISLPAKVAPYKCSILTLIQDEKLEPFVNQITTDFKKLGVSHKVDVSGSTIGKRYARTDEVGVPFGITIDFQTVDDKTVTLREIITTLQVRIPVSEVASVINDLSEDLVSWEQVTAKYPAFVQKEEDK